jgi:hypothetical protein
MKIQKFNENSSTDSHDAFFLFLEKNPYGEDYVYILDTYQNACKFLVYKIYEILERNNSDSFEDFEEDVDFNNLDALKESYNEVSNIYGEVEFEYFMGKIETVEFEDWMQTRLESKKYNI